MEVTLHLCTFFLSLIEPFPRTMILHPVSFSNCLAYMPLGPSILPTKLNCKGRGWNTYKRKKLTFKLRNITRGYQRCNHMHGTTPSRYSYNGSHMEHCTVGWVLHSWYYKMPSEIFIGVNYKYTYTQSYLKWSMIIKRSKLTTSSKDLSDKNGMMKS